MLFYQNNVIFLFMPAKLQIKNGLTKRLAHFSYVLFYFLALFLENSLDSFQHALVLNQVEELLNHSVQTGNLV